MRRIGPTAVVPYNTGWVWGGEHDRRDVDRNKLEEEKRQQCNIYKRRHHNWI